MADFYFPSLDIIKLSASGERLEVRLATIIVTNITQGSVTLTSLTTDANGTLPEGSYATADPAADGDVIELSHATYPETTRLTLKSTQELAYTTAENNVAAFIIENLFTSTNDSEAADVYAVDTAELGSAPVYIGTAKAGETTLLAFQTGVAKTMRFYAFSTDITGQRNTVDFNYAPSVDLAIPAVGGGVTAFTGLSDVPASYATHGLKVVRVNAGATALEFVTLAGGGDMLAANNLSDLINAVTARTNLGLGTIATQNSAALNGVFVYGGFKINDNADDHNLLIRLAENLTANRILNLLVGDASRNLTIGGDATLNGGTHSGINTGDQTLPVKATGAEINTGTDDVKFATAKAIADSNVAYLSDITGINSGTNTGDNATNSQYSGLAASKQDTLVSGTNIKTVNGSSILGAGDLAVAASISQTEVDFGTTPLAEQTFTITDAGVSGTSQIIAQVAWEAPTGKDVDEIEMDDLQIRCKPAAGSFDMFIRSADGSYLADKFKISYLVG